MLIATRQIQAHQQTQGATVRFLIKIAAFVFFLIAAPLAYYTIAQVFPVLEELITGGNRGILNLILWPVLAGLLVKLLVTRPLDRLWPETYRTVPPGYGERPLDQRMLGWHFRNRPRR